MSPQIQEIQRFFKVSDKVERPEDNVVVNSSSLLTSALVALAFFLTSCLSISASDEAEPSTDDGLSFAIVDKISAVEQSDELLRLR